MKMFLIVTSLVVAVSIACTGSKPAASQSQANTGASPSPGPSANPMTQDGTTQTKTPCTLTFIAAPVIGGLKLRMTPDEVLALFPGSKDDADLRNALSQPRSPFGVSSFAIRPSKYGDNDQFKNVKQINFTLLDGRVSTFSIGYNGPQWPDVDAFVAKFVQGKSLPPPEEWEAYPGMDNQLKILTCKDFEIRVFAGGEGGNLNYILMKDLEADKELKDRRAKARAAASPTPAN